jgi:hypothetical protein
MVEALHGALEQALADPAVGAGLREQGYTLAHQTPGEFQALISADIDRYAAVTRALLDGDTDCARVVAAWLAGHRRQRTQSLVDRLQQALDEGELRAGTNVQALGDFYATQLHGISVQARDGVPRDRLLAAVDTALLLLDQALQPAGQTR